MGISAQALRGLPFPLPGMWSQSWLVAPWGLVAPWPLSQQQELLRSRGSRDVAFPAFEQF